MPDTARTKQALHGDAWDRTDQLLAGIVDRLAVANWQRANNKRNPRPQPIPRPGVEKGKRFGTKAMSIEDWRTRHGRGHQPEGVNDGR